MLPSERQQKILELVQKKTFVKISELCLLFDSTPPTIRKDIAILTEHQKVLSIWGGATIFPSTPRDIPFLLRKEIMLNEKRIISKNVIKELPNKAVIFMDTSTTILSVAKELVHAKDKNLTIITNFLDAINILRETNHIKLILCGGELKKHHDFFDNITMLQAKSYDADIALLGCHGVTPEGFFNKSPDSTNMKKIMVSRSKQTWICADHSKLGRTGNFKFLDLKDCSKFFCDDLPDKWKPLFKS